MKTVKLVLVGALTIACSSAADRFDPSPEPQSDNGQTGSPSYLCTEEDCAATAQEILDSLAQSSPAPTFVGASCHPPDTGPAEADTRPTIYCRCDQSDGGFFLISDTSLGVGCEVRGRGGFCIFDDRDFTGCDVNDPHSCDATCSTLQSRLEADAANNPSAELRFSGCVPPPPSSPSGTMKRCGVVLRMDGRCFTNDDGGAVLKNEPVDCSLSDQQILSPWSGDSGDGGDGGAAGAASTASPQP